MAKREQTKPPALVARLQRTDEKEKTLSRVPPKKTATKSAKVSPKTGSKLDTKAKPVKAKAPEKPQAKVETKKALKAKSSVKPQPKPKKQDAAPAAELIARVVASLDDDKAQDIVTIELAGRSSLCDAVIVATGTSSRHVASTAEHLARRLKEAGYGAPKVEGLGTGDWVLVDAGDVIVHLFRAEVRSYYDLESMWSVDEAAKMRPGHVVQ
jgi:ribosome-associated protein